MKKQHATTAPDLCIDRSQFNQFPTRQGRSIVKGRKKEATRRSRSESKQLVREY